MLNILEEKISQFLPHAYVTSAQSRYLKDRKQSLQRNEALVLLDFSENYKMIVQDEIQEFHWTQQAITMHPVIIYINTGERVENINMCFFTSDLNHDITMVKNFQYKVMVHLKENFPSIDTVEFFSDGCAGQYKNPENFAHLLTYKKKYNLNVKWNFFCTSHGKSPCDGLAGAMKRTLRLASLQRPYDKQILSLDLVI